MNNNQNHDQRQTIHQLLKHAIQIMDRHPRDPATLKTVKMLIEKAMNRICAGGI